MKVTHEFEVRALCPVDGSEDVYAAKFTTHTIVPVEEILSKAAMFAGLHLYQETLTRLLHDELGETVTTVGTHSGVVTTVTVEP